MKTDYSPSDVSWPEDVVKDTETVWKLLLNAYRTDLNKRATYCIRRFLNASIVKIHHNGLDIKMRSGNTFYVYHRIDPIADIKIMCETPEGICYQVDVSSSEAVRIQDLVQYIVDKKYGN